MEVRSESGLLSPAKIQTLSRDTKYQIPSPTLNDTLLVIDNSSSSSTSSTEDNDTISRETPSGESGFSEMEFTSPEMDTLPERSRLSSTDSRQDDDDDDVSSTISDISGASELSGLDWRAAGPLGWIQRQIHMGADPRHVLAKIVSKDSVAAIPPTTDDYSLWKMLIKIITNMQWRKKLDHINTLDDVLSLIRRSRKILVLTGAGVSVSCGIPDFRSPKGIYARLARDFPDLPDPHAMFDIRYFNTDPRPFFKFAREIYPGQFQPSACHKFIRALESHGKLLRNYTQNIDTLEQVAGIERVVQCHGSFATATCTHCKRKVDADSIRDDILSQRIPVCQICVPEGAQQALLDLDNAYSGLVVRGVMKPDIVFFGEGLPQDFHEAMMQDRDQADLLLIIGSSLKVQPVALIPSSLPTSVPQVLINREPLPDCKVDVELLGDADVIVDHLCRELVGDWADLCWRNTPLRQAEMPSCPSVSFATAPPSDVELTSENVVIDTSDSCNIVVPECSRKRPGSPLVSPQPVKNVRREERIDSIDSVILSADAEVMEMNCKEGPSFDSAPCKSDDVMNDDDWRDARQIKLRQMSSDSTRDSGIAEAAEPADERMHLPSFPSIPENSFLFVPPNRYLFPGAEVPVMHMRSSHFVSFSDSDLCCDVSSSSSSPSRDSPASSPQLM